MAVGRAGLGFSACGRMRQNKQEVRQNKQEVRQSCRNLCYALREMDGSGADNPVSPLSLGYSQFSSIQELSCVRLFVTAWTVAPQASLSITNSRSLLTLLSIESVMPSRVLYMRIFHCKFTATP